MKIGYARVSTRDQNLELQIEALQKYGCEQLFQEKQSAVKDRPELDRMLNILRTEENKKKPGESRYSISDIIQLLKISRATYYRYLQFDLHYKNWA